MKKYLSLSVFIISVLASCSKSGDNNVANNSNQPISNTTGNTTNNNGYVIKTIGVSYVMLAVDDSYKLVTAYLYGGGNKVVLKAGTANTMSMTNGNISTLPDAVAGTPDGVMPYQDINIDNGKLADTLSSACIKLKGFDKAKTGYNQLNVVMLKYVYPANITGGYYTNLTFLKMKEAAGKKNADYAGQSFITGVFTGNVNVSAVEMAPPVSTSTYITEDHIVSVGQSVYGIKEAQPLNAYLSSYDFKYNNDVKMGTPLWPVPNGLTAEWVNADNGSVITYDIYDYAAKFNNIKVGGRELVPEPTDSVTNVYLRVKGFDRTQFGFNQLRLFIANDGVYNGNLQMSYNAKPTAPTTLSTIKGSYAAPAFYCLLASPLWHHY